MTDTRKTFGEMTDAEKGALLLAHHEGKAIMVSAVRGGYSETSDPLWLDQCVYFVKPEPVVETATLYFKVSGRGIIRPALSREADYKLEYTYTDGDPDCASIRMEKI